jgi:hypothetical protein
MHNKDISETLVWHGVKQTWKITVDISTDEASLIPLLQCVYLADSKNLNFTLRKRIFESGKDW